jgi:serine/threonine protein kinase
MHRDVKPENFLVNETSGRDVLKLADFGLAKQISNENNKLTEYVSTRWYRAPELALETANYGLKVDIFALGCIMAEMYLGRPIFPGRNSVEQFSQIVGVMGTPPIDWFEGYQLAKDRNITINKVQSTFDSIMSKTCISEPAKDLLKLMLSYD